MRGCELPAVCVLERMGDLCHAVGVHAFARLFLGDNGPSLGSALSCTDHT